MTNAISIIKPDDWHVHLRQAPYLKDTVLASALHFQRVLVMPNLLPPLCEVSAIMAYREAILAELPANHDFCPYMTFYLNDSVQPEELFLASQIPYILGAKLYPAGATTHSEQGVSDITCLYPLLEVMQSLDLVLQIHGEKAHGDIFGRESAFIKNELTLLIKNFPKLRIVLEHISTHEAVEFVMQAPDTLAATITPQHLLYNRNDLLAGGIKPHYYCLPILKKERDQQAIQKAATSGNPKFFAGTDSAPHAQLKKESACGCAGIFSAPYAIALYTECFETLGYLDRLENFLSYFGAIFYQLSPNTQRIELVKKPQTIPNTLTFGEETVVPIAAGERIGWSVYV